MSVSSTLSKSRIVFWLRKSGVAWLSLYLIYFLLRQVQIITDYLAPLQLLFVVWGYLILAVNLAYSKRMFAFPGQKALIILIGAGLLALMANWNVDPVTQIKSLIFLVLLVLVAYPVGRSTSESNHPEKTLAWILVPAQFITFIQGVAACWSLYARYSFLETEGEKTIRLGFQIATYESENPVGILFGFYVDSNHGALFAFLSVLVSLWLITVKSKLTSKKYLHILIYVFSIINFLVQLFFFVLANSRGAEVAALVSVVLSTLVFIWKVFSGNADKSKKAMSTISVLAIVVLLVGGYLLAQNVIQKGANSYMAESPQGGLTVVREDSQTHKESSGVIKKWDYSKGDAIKSARMGIWAEVFDLWRHKPVFGIGPYNQKHYALEYKIGEQNPSKFLKWGYFPHNSYLDVLLYYGFIGFLAYVIFFGEVIYSLIKGRFRNPPETSDVFLLAGFFSIMAGVLFLSGTFLGMDYLSAVLMTIIGFIVAKYGSWKTAGNRDDL